MEFFRDSNYLLSGGGKLTLQPTVCSLLQTGNGEERGVCMCNAHDTSSQLLKMRSDVIFGGQKCAVGGPLANVMYFCSFTF